jgi:hypothetical protein
MSPIHFRVGLSAFDANVEARLGRGVAHRDSNRRIFQGYSQFGVNSQLPSK